jgi:gluconate 2-dehydrogenase gamma chain
MTDEVSRRNLLKTAGAAGAIAIAPGAAGAQDVNAAPAATHTQRLGAQRQESVSPSQLFFFNDEEARFVQAAVDRLIPEDSEWPGAANAGVLYFIDGQLASAYGAGARMYLKGPWVADAPAEQGYQLRFSPAELYRVGVEEVREHVRRTYSGREFWDLEPQAMDELLKQLERGSIELPSLPSPVFFETLLANTVEGFFADPAYGGNRDMVGWRMVGFPGAYAQYLDLVDVHGVAYTRRPISMGNQSARQAHIADHSHR